MSDAGQRRLPVADAAVRRAAFDLVRRDGRGMVVVVLLNCLAAAAGLVGPRLLGVMVNDVQAGARTSRIDLLSAAIVGFAVLQLLLTRYARYTGQRMGERAPRRLREQFVERVLALPTSVVEKAGTGDLMTRSAGDVAVLGGAAPRCSAPSCKRSSSGSRWRCWIRGSAWSAWSDCRCCC